MKVYSYIGASILFVHFVASLSAQTPGKLAFEVATIKPSPSLSSLAAQVQSGKLDLGMRMDGARVDLKFLSLSNMIAMAYKVKPHQISGPDWMPSQLFEIQAKLPEGSNKDQIPEMMQSLLEERFGLRLHRETKEQPVYALTVAKSGLKAKEVPEEAQKPAAEAEASPAKEAPGKDVTTVKTPEGEMKLKREGNTMVMDAGVSGKMRMNMGENGTMRWELPKMKMPDFSDLLSQFTDRPVVDMTELKGFYEMELEVPMQELLNLAKKMMPEIGALAGGAAPGAAAPASGLAGVSASDPTGSAMFQAVQRLGLKLESRRLPTDTLVIDAINKTPTEN